MVTKHTPSIWYQKPPHSWQYMVGVLKYGYSTTSGKPGKRNMYSIARSGELPPLLYYSQVYMYLRKLHNQLMDWQNIFFESVWMLSGNE